jgi:hypothetical protein
MSEKDRQQEGRQLTFHLATYLRFLRKLQVGDATIIPVSQLFG